VALVFTEGFTVVPADGYWYDHKKKVMINEPSMIIIILQKTGQLTSSKADSVRARYKKMFSQQSVLRVDKKVKADF
jgi:hypothetical protein